LGNRKSNSIGARTVAIYREERLRGNQGRKLMKLPTNKGLFFFFGLFYGKIKSNAKQHCYQASKIGDEINHF